MENGERTDEKLTPSGFDDKEDRKEQGEGSGGFRRIEEEPEESAPDDPNKNTPQASQQDGKIPKNTI